MTSTEAGRITMTTQCQHIPGGIWGAAFNLLLDQSEASLVRQQVSGLLLILSSSAPLEDVVNIVKGCEEWIDVCSSVLID